MKSEVLIQERLDYWKVKLLDNDGMCGTSVIQAIIKEYKWILEE